MKSDLLNSVCIASPCSVGWESMKGDDRQRFCDQCELHVYDISQLTSAEAIALIAGSEGRFCGRLHRRADGTVITRDCPVGLRALRQRVARRAGAVFATILGLSATLFAQSGARQRDTVSRESAGIQNEQSKEQQATIAGTVTDQGGALVAGASVELTEETRHERLLTVTNELGQYCFNDLKPGKYSLLIAGSSFKKHLITEIVLKSNETLRLDSSLEAGAVMGLIMITDEGEISTDDSPLNIEPIRKRPL